MTRTILAALLSLAIIGAPGAIATTITSQAQGPGPVQAAHTNATVERNETGLDLYLAHETQLAPTTQNDTLDDLARDATAGTALEALLWGWHVDQEGQVDATVHTR